MISTTDLWLPILLSAVGIIIVNSIVCMATPLHKGDFKKMPGEEKILAEMRNQGVNPGGYMFPCAESMKDMGSPEMIEKEKLGPVGFITVANGPCNMGKTFILWFLYSILVSAFIAHLATQAFNRAAPFKHVFHLTALAAILAYAARPLPESIWKGQQWSTTLKFVFDGILSAIVTGLAFAWLWPA